MLTSLPLSYERLACNRASAGPGRRRNGGARNLRRWVGKILGRSMTPRWARFFLAVAAGLGLIDPAAALGQTNNVVVVQTDDLGWTQSSAPHSQQFATGRGDADAFYETPHLNTLASRSLFFPNAYAPSPVCSPSRMSLITGLNPANHGMTNWIAGNNEYGADWETSIPTSSTLLPEVFQSNGYQTAQIGKWHLGEAGTNSADPSQHGYDVNVGGGHMGLPQGPQRYFADGSGSFNLPNLGNGSSNPGEYLPDRLARAATDFIADATANNEPFFLSMNNYGVHTPIEAPANRTSYYRQKLDNNSYANFNNLTNGEKDDLATYAALVEGVDHTLGSILDQLETSGVSDDTIVVFTSDNGGLSVDESNFDAPADINSPLRSGKGNRYEGGLRAPLFVSVPGVTDSGGQSDALVSNTDLYPTLLDLGGVTGGDSDIDGQSFVASLQGTDNVGRDMLVFHYPHTSNQREGAQTGAPFSAVRQGDWKFIETYHEDGTTTQELYNLSSDLGESNNLIDSEATRAQMMRSEMRDYLRSVDALVPSGHTLEEQQGLNLPDSSVLVNFWSQNTAANEQPISVSGVNNINQYGDGDGVMVRVDGSASPITVNMINEAGGDGQSNAVTWQLPGENPFQFDGADPTALARQWLERAS